MLRLIALMAIMMLMSTTVATVALANGATQVAPQPVVTPQPVATPQPTPAQPAAPGAGPAQPAMYPQANAMAVDANAVYIVSDNQLWKFNKFTGQLLGCTMLPTTQAQPAGVGAGVGAGTQVDQTPQPVTSVPSIEVPLPPTELDPTQPAGEPDLFTGEVQPGAAGAGPGMQYTQPAAGAGPSMAPASSVAVDNNTVYVVRGNQLLRFRSDTLQFVGSSVLAGNQTIAQPGMAGAGPGEVCPPGVATGTGSQQVTTGVPAQPGAGPGVCPPSTISVGINPDVQTDINMMQGMSSCQMEEAYMRSLVRTNSGAIAWSQLAQQRASQPQLQDFAGEVVTVKSQQNQQMQQWASNWYNADVATVVSPADAQTYANLQNLRGADFDVAYMQAMLNHNAGVARMSSQMQQRVCHAEAGRAINTVRNVQARQSDQLRVWLRDWYNVTAL